MANLIYLFCLLTIVFPNANAQTTDPKCLAFSCVSTTEFEIYGNTVKCPDNKLCNRNCTPEVNDLTGTSSTPTCIDANLLCPFTCSSDNNTIVIITDETTGVPVTIQHQCVKNTICNPELNRKSCDLCIVPPCPAQQFQCKDDNKTVIFQESMEAMCPGNSLCNRENVQPCSFCIPPPEINISTNAATTPTTTRIPIATTTTLPTKPTNATTLLTTTTTIATTTKSTIPNCNDGYGGSLPCRYGSNGFYYKCRMLSSNMFFAEKILCSEWNRDPICSRYRVCV